MERAHQGLFLAHYDHFSIDSREYGFTILKSGRLSFVIVSARRAMSAAMRIITSRAKALLILKVMGQTLGDYLCSPLFV